MRHTIAGFRLASSTATRSAQVSRLVRSVPAASRPFSSTARRSSNLTNILAAEDDAVALSISKLTARGFHLTDDLSVPGGSIIVDGKPFLWDVNPPNLKAPTSPEFWKDLDADAFKIFEVVLPRPEILLFGTGPSVVPPPKAIREYISSSGIQLDTMDSRNAASTYNLSQEEGRKVALALCPNTNIDPRTGAARST